MNVKKLNFSWGAYTPPPPSLSQLTFNSRSKSKKPGGSFVMPWARLPATLLFISFMFVGLFACGNDGAPMMGDPTVAWSAATSTTTEGGTAATITLTSDTAPAGDLNISVEISGSATLTTDYTLAGLSGDGTSRMLIIPAGMSEASFTLTALNDGVIENDETVVFTLAAGSGFELGSQSAHTATITDDPFIIEWSAATSTTTEGGTAATITLTSDTAPAGDLNVSIEISGSATLTSDYTLAGLTGDGTSRMLSIPAGMSEASFTLTALNDGVIENDETVVFTLAAGSGYMLGSQSAHTATITDPPFIVEWSSATSTTTEGGTATTVTLTSNTAPASDLNVSVEISGGATLTTDYTLAGLSGTGASRMLSISAGDSQASFTLTAVDDSVVNEAGETAVFTLTAGSDYMLGSQSAHTATITDTPFVVLWNSGTAQGNFGFDRCQNILAGSTGIGPALRNAGFTKAIFFGSTPSYNFPDIATDADALGIQTGTYTFAAAATALNVRVASFSSSTVSYTSMFGGSTRTLGNLAGIASGGGWQNGGAQIVAAAGITSSTRFWSFTRDRGHNANNCSGATSNNGVVVGLRGNSTSIDVNTSVGLASSTSCSNAITVLCLAR